MSDHNAASRILSSEAKLVLAPMGLKQKGRSRIWLDDHGWWVGVVEFQPSSWSKGSYLNVGCWILWQVKNYISYDLGRRAEHHKNFENQRQFRPEATRLAIHAGQEIEYWRNTLPTVASLACYFRSQTLPQNLWPHFNAAIASGLSGELSLASNYFNQIGAPEETDYEWQRAAKLSAARLYEILPDAGAFRNATADQVHQCRALNKLPQLTNLNFDGPQSD